MRSAGGCALVVVLAALLTFTHLTSSQQIACRGGKLLAAGCFVDKRSSARPLPVLLFTDRNKKDPKFSGVSIPAKPNSKYISDILCRCARSAMLKGYTMMGVQAGECLSGPTASSTYLNNGRSGSCLGLNLKACTATAKSCIGKLGANFVYKVIKDPTKPTTKKPTVKPGKLTTKKPTPKPVLSCRDFNITLKILTAYSYALLSHNSAEFGKLRLELEVGVMQAYDGYKPFVGVHVLRFDKSSDGKVNCNFVVHLSKTGLGTTHLGVVEKKIASGKLGKLTVDKTLAQKSCYKIPTFCPAPCPTVCAPFCSHSCCGHYSPPPPPPCGALCPSHCAPSCNPTCCAPPPPPPPPLPPPPPPPPPTCGAFCPSFCAPSCSPTCCAPPPPPLPLPPPPPSPQVKYCPHNCSPSCAPHCSYSCCAMTRGYKRNHADKHKSSADLLK